MKYDFNISKSMARCLAMRFGHAFINYTKNNGYFVTSSSTSNTIATVDKTGGFEICRSQMNYANNWKR